MSRRSRKWCFTLNNPQLTADELIQTIIDKWDKTIWIVLQKEEGEQKTPHFQGFFVVKNPIAFRSVSQLKWGEERLGWHLENPRGSDEQNLAYCTKEEGRIEGPWYWPDEETVRAEAKASQGKRNDLADVYDRIKKGESIISIADAHPGTTLRYLRSIERMRHLVAKPKPRKRRVAVFYGESRTGKSYRAVGDYKSVYIKQDNSQWFDGYDQEKKIVWEEFQWEEVSIQRFLRICDRYPIQVPIKGSYVSLNHKRIIFTSNVSPTEWYQNHASYDAVQNRIHLIVKFFKQPDGTRDYVIEKGTQALLDKFS